MTTRSEAALETGSQALIYDLCPLFREALADVVRTMPAFRGCVTVSTAQEELPVLDAKGVDFALIDLDAGAGGLELLQRIKATRPECRCVMMIADGSQPELMAAIRLQADGFLTKRLTAQEFVRELQAILSGEMVISDTLTSALALSLRNVPYMDENRDISTLSPRELEVLKCIASGMSNRLISERLAISEGTVKVHVKHLLKKLKFTTRVEAALWASEHGHR